MSYPHADWTREDYDRLMALTTVLADLTASVPLAGSIPHAMASSLGLESVTLAVVRPGEPAGRLELLAHSSPDHSAEFREKLARRMMDVYGSTRPLAAGELPAMRDGYESPVAVGEQDRELVVNRAIDEHQRLLLVVVYHGGSTPEVLMSTLDMVSAHLARLLGVLLAWTRDPSVLGAPFDRLTDREWTVLQALQSEDGEKQLAEHLDLSPHTLHSHIKSIYRKLGVQGRLPVLLRLASAQRGLRARLGGVSRAEQAHRAASGPVRMAVALGS